MTFRDILAKFRNISFSERDKGDRFERLPIVEVERDCGDIRHDGSGPVEEEQPAGDVCAFFAEEFACVGHERAGG